MKQFLAVFSALAVTAMLFASLPMTALAAGKGDFNGDGKLNSLDAREMIKVAIDDGNPTWQQIFWGDFDVDEAITTVDVREILTMLLDNIGTSAPDYAHPTDEDYWGENSINVLGDSISFGVGTSNDANPSSWYNTTGGIPEYSYVSFVKKAVQAANGGKMNYGFTSAYPTAWPGVARSEEIHYWPDRTNDADGNVAWVCDNNDDGNRLTSIGMTARTPWATLTYKLRKEYVNEYKYFCVYYQCEPGAGSFAIADGNGGEVPYADGTKTGYIQTASQDGTSTTKRTAFFKLADCAKDSNGSPKIAICHNGDTLPVTITGIGYYKELPKADNADGYVTFNSFTRGGISLINLSDDVLDKATSADTLIMGLGYNDFCFNHARVNQGEFKAKIDTLIRLCNEKGTQVIVNDYAWKNPVVSDKWIDSQKTAHATVKSELRRFAKETGGIYIDQQAIWGDEIIASLNDPNEITGKAGDNVHPNLAGHKMMAKAVVEALGLEWTEDWT